MEHHELDSLTGIHYSWIKLLVHNFFPFSLQIDDTGEQPIHNKDIMHTVGSVPENLHLPCLHRKNTSEVFVTDKDMMISYEISLYIDGKIIKMSTMAKQENMHPLHCEIRYFWNGPDGRVYATIPGNQLVKECLTSTNLPQYLKKNIKIDGVHGTVQIHTEHDSDYIDLVPCIPIPCPESILKPLKKRFYSARSSSLPKLMEVVDLLQSDGIHIVHKAHISSSNPKDEYRFSFSVIEREIACSLNGAQRRAYRVLKGLVKSEINIKANSDEDKLPSYLLKTILFWVCELLPWDFCAASNTGKLFLLLLDKLIHSLSEGWISHFFIPEGNLLDGYKDHVKLWMKSLSKIRQEPQKTITNFWKTYDLDSEGITERLYYFFIQSTHLWEIVENPNEELVNKLMPYVSEEPMQIYVAAKEKPDIETQHDTFTRRMMKLHFVEKNISDMIRHMIATPSIFSCHCVCTNKMLVIKDFDEGCKKCMNAAFCEVTEKYPRYFFPVLLPEVANMWYVRSIHEKANKELYQRKAAAMFEQALKHKAENLYYTNVHYALYLMARKKIEKAVASILEVLTSQENSGFTSNYGKIFKFSCFLCKMVDKVIQKEMILNPCLDYTKGKLLYHLLCSCYNQLGLYTEILIPLPKEYPKRYEQLTFSKKILNYTDFKLLFAEQYFLKADYHQAAKLYETKQNLLICAINFLATEMNLLDK